MRKFLIASHGKFSYGVIDTMEILIGKQKNVDYMCAYSEKVNECICEKVKERIDQLEDEDELIILTDVLGGSVTNEFAKYIHRKNVHIIAGINMLLLMELLLDNGDMSISMLINRSIKRAKEGMAYLNEMNVESEPDF